MRKLLALVITILLLSLPFAAQAQDDDEDSGLDIPVLIDGDLVEDSFGEDVFARLYAFSGTEGDLVSFRMEPVGDDSVVDPYLILLGEAGEVLASNDDFESGNPSAQVDEFELPETGTYFLLATTWGERRDQSFAVETQDEDNLDYVLAAVGFNTPEDADAIPVMQRGEVEIGMSGTLELTADEPIFFITFEAEAGDVVTIGALSDDVDTLLYLFDAEGNRLAVNDDREPGDLSAELREIELDDDGVYLIMVMPFDFYDAYLEDVVEFGTVEFSIE